MIGVIKKPNIYIPKKKEYQGIWVPKTWNGLPSLSGFYGNNIWSDGINIYYSGGSNASSGEQYILNRETSTWSALNDWSPYIAGEYIWTDGTDFFNTLYNSSLGYNLNWKYTKSSSTWGDSSYYAPTNYSYGIYVWNEGDNVYYSNGGGNNLKLNKSTGRWNSQSWSGAPSSLTGRDIWTDNSNNIYFSDGSSRQYILNKNTSTWSQKTWQQFSGISGRYVWTDGTNMYYSSSSSQKVLTDMGSGMGWYDKTWQGLTSFYGHNIWKDGEHIYYSSSYEQYELT